ncbi:MAG: hypothetical protein QW035_02185 [Candidatus Anstonellales archaeon]
MKKQPSRESTSQQESVMLAGALLVGVVLGIAIGYGVFVLMAPPQQQITQTTANNTTSFQISNAKIQEQLGYFEEYYALMGQKIKFTLVSAKLNQEGLIEASVKEATTGQEITFYFTQKYNFVPQGPVNLKEVLDQIKQQFVIPTAEKPVVKLFIMSYCPYGNIAENAIKDVILLLDNKIDFEPVYIISGSNGNYQSLHGVNELNQDIREKLIYKEYGSKVWMEYVYAVNAQCSLDTIETCWKEVADSMGIDSSKIQQRYDSEFNAIADEEVQKTISYQVTGSPTLLINGKPYNGQRSASAYLEGICSGFNNPPSECSAELSGATSAPSGSCG